MDEQEMRESGDRYTMTEAKDVAHAVDVILCDRQAGEFTIGIEPLRTLCAGLRAAIQRGDKFEELYKAAKEAN